MLLYPGYDFVCNDSHFSEKTIPQFLEKSLLLITIDYVFSQYKEDPVNNIIDEHTTTIR